MTRMELKPTLKEPSLTLLKETRLGPEVLFKKQNCTTVVKPIFSYEQNSIETNFFQLNSNLISSELNQIQFNAIEISMENSTHVEFKGEKYCVQLYSLNVVESNL